MNTATISSSTFTVTGSGGAAVAGTVTYTASGSVATFTPSVNLGYSTQYTATITTGAQDSTGTALAANYTWSFTTAAAPVAPTVTSVTPLNMATGVAITSTLTATFSQAMNAATLTASTFTLTGPGAAAVTGTVTYAATGSVATFTPAANLAYSTQYTATITTGATDSTGTALAAIYAWTFTTAPAPVPTIASTVPANSATSVAVSQALTAAFSQPMNASTITSSTFTLTVTGGAAVTGTVTYFAGGQCGLVCPPAATFTPSGNLAYDTQYTATITTGAADSSGISLAAPYVWTFTTALAPAPPTVVATVPANGATNVSLSQALTATFSQTMNATTITSSTFAVTGPGSAAVTGAVTYSAANSIATFTPAAALAYNTAYTATITTGVTDTAGTALAANYVWTFTTAANPNLVTVDYGTEQQIIRGFGGSTAWLGQMPQAVATALFDPIKGLGMSILRVRIDPEGSASSANPYETGEWDYEAANGAEAVAANPNAIVFATPWTPPSSMKTSSTSQPYYAGACSPAAGYCGGYLNPSNYAAYASYLEDFVTFFNSKNTFDLYAISMQNEPEENVSYESCLWTPQQMDTWIAGNASVLSAKLIMPESDTFNPVDAATALADPNAEGLISIIGGHLYGGPPAPYTIPAGDSPKEIWMTEFGPLSTATPTYAESLTYAESVHNSMVTGQYNAYVWWGIFGTPTAAGTWGLVDNSGNPSVMGYAIGQFSKFIQPGYYRYDATANPSANVYVSAYAGTDSGTQHYVIVAINAGTSAVSQSFTIENGTVTALTPYQTTSAGGLAQQTAIPVPGGQFTYMLPAQSITTFVQ